MIDHAVLAAVHFAGTMNHMERKATALQTAAVHLEAAGIVEALGRVGMAEVEVIFGSVEHVTAVGIAAEIVGSFAEFLGSAGIGNDAHEVRVESLACIGMAAGFEREVRQGAYYC